MLKLLKNPDQFGLALMLLAGVLYWALLTYGPAPCEDEVCEWSQEQLAEDR